MGNSGRISGLLVASALVLMATPALAQLSPVSSAALSAPTPGVVTVDGKTANIYYLSGGDVLAEVVTTKGQPTHLGPSRYTPVRIQTDATGLLSLSNAAGGLLGGKPVRTTAMVVIGGRSLMLNGARITAIALPACVDGKVKSSRIDVEISFDALKIATDKAPAYVPPLALTTCTIALGDLKSDDVSGLDSLTISATPQNDGIGEMRDYGKIDESARPGDVRISETATHSGASNWARQFIVLGDAKPTQLKVVYNSASGPVLSIGFGDVMPYTLSLDQGRGVDIRLATLKPSIGKP